MRQIVAGVALLLASCTPAFGFFQADGGAQTIRFDSEDGVSISADLYLAHANLEAPFIVLCHQAGWSRGEYQEIAPKLNEMGFNCMAIDQRSGGTVNSVDNETMASAQSKGMETGFVDATADIVSALEFARGTLAHGKLILWGSSYSAALSLKIAGDSPDLVDGVLAFAPGEYFARFDKPGDWVQQSASNIADPAFITSAQNEFNNWSAIFDAIPGESKMKFVPETTGNHGSRALWEKFDDNGAYWEAATQFLSQFTEVATEEGR